MKCFFGILMVFSSSLAFAQALQFDTNVSSELKAQVMGDLKFLEGVQGNRASTLHREIFGALEGANYLKWFSGRVSFFGVSDCGSPASAVACVDPKAQRKIWVTGNYTGINHPQVARVMTLFHEARHTEDQNKNWPHALCPLFYSQRSIWTGKPLRLHSACDRTVLGSYGSASIMLHNVSKFCLNCSTKVRLDADLYSKDQAKRVTRRKAQRQIMGDFQE